MIHGAIPCAPLTPCSSFPPSLIADAVPIHRIRQAILGISCIIRIYIEDNWSSILSSTTRWVATPDINQTTHHIWPKDAAEAPLETLTCFKEEKLLLV